MKRKTVLAILTWPTYGTWFARRGRGWIDRDERPSRCGLPEPRRRGARPTWPAIQLDAVLQAAVIDDLRRNAALRDFRVLVAVAAEDHVHVLLECQRDREVPRLVQMVKGAASRALSRAAGDTAPKSAAGEPVPHRKWWSRQYAFRAICDEDDLQRTLKALEAHPADRTTRFKSGSPISFSGDDAIREPTQ